MNRALENKSLRGETLAPKFLEVFPREAGRAEHYLIMGGRGKVRVWLGRLFLNIQLDQTGMEWVRRQDGCSQTCQATPSGAEAETYSVVEPLRLQPQRMGRGGGERSPEQIYKQTSLCPLNLDRPQVIWNQHVSGWGAPDYNS